MCHNSRVVCLEGLLLQQPSVPFVGHGKPLSLEWLEACCHVQVCFVIVMNLYSSANDALDDVMHSNSTFY